MDSLSKNFLGVDWGKSSVGLALADGETQMAFGYGKLKNDRNLPGFLVEIIKKESVGSVIIGKPVYLEKSETIQEGKKLGEFLKKETGVEIFYQDEMFTTKMAQANLIEKGTRNISNHDDREAARIILQSWLDELVGS